MSRFHLYRHYDANGDLLYVGQSNNCFSRYRDHRHKSEWTASSVEMRIEHFDSREEVVAAEREAIVLEKPRFNRRHKIQPPKIPGTLLQMRVSDEFLAAIDDWRRAQPDIPVRTEAIRRLVEQALGTRKKR